ncbi:MAG: YHYH protein [Akkermansiaceae bacterium]|nr:YHYH protein [Akkermansiaceae bacterium]MCP5549547.1 YHYH protein [Akkermansiaceae bacterium]
MRFPRLGFSLILCFAGLALAVLGQGPGGGPPRLRQHTANRAQPVRLEPATQDPPGESRHAFDRSGGDIEVSANAIPEHKVGRFPNSGNPNTIQPQRYEIVIPGDPREAANVTPLSLSPFGIALNGVFFDPGAAEFWQGDPSLGWQYEALGGAVALGIDENHAHVQPTGTYHYHGLPTLFLKQLGVSEGKHSAQIGWAADGFPIYALFGYEDAKDTGSKVVKLTSSWRLKQGDRPDGRDGPGGKHDGAFVQDYEYVEGSGDLDECNGRFCVTPEFPDGTYAYFLTEEWPVIPRSFRGTPVTLRGPDGGPGPRGGGPPGGGRPPRGGGGPGGFPPPPPPGGRRPPPPPR